MKILLLLSILLIAVFPLLAQESTLSPSTQQSVAPKDVVAPNVPKGELKNILIIPFEPKLYHSDADREIAAKNNMNQEQIRNEFRKGIGHSLFAELSSAGMTPIVLLNNENEDALKDLAYVYKSIGYQAKPVPQDAVTKAEEPALKEAFGKVKEKFEAKPEPAGTSVRNGQIYSVSGNGEIYMSTRVINPNLVPYLCNKYQAKYILFVNELDIRVAPGTDHRAFELEDYQREIKVHYTVVDASGKEVYGSAEKSYVSNRINDTDRIIKGSFPYVSKLIAGNIQNPPLDKEQSKLQKTQEKKAQKQEEDLESTY